MGSRANGTNSRALETNQRALKINPRRTGDNPRIKFTFPHQWENEGYGRYVQIEDYSKPQ